jgi:hypothetical protein
MPPQFNLSTIVYGKFFGKHSGGLRIINRVEDDIHSWIREFSRAGSDPLVVSIACGAEFIYRLPLAIG